MIYHNAFNPDLQTSLNNAAGKKLVIAGGSYTTSGLSIPVGGCEIETDGPVVINMTAAPGGGNIAAAIGCGGRSNFRISGHFTLVGNGPAYPGQPNSMQDLGQTGINLDGSDQYEISGKWQIMNMQGAAVRIANSPNGSGQYSQHAIISGVSGRDNTTGLYYAPAAEYNKAFACSFARCNLGVVVEAANVKLIGVSANDCSVGLKLIGSGNPGHGIVEGGEFNHNYYALVCDSLTAMGYEITGSHFIGDLDPSPGGNPSGAARMQFYGGSTNVALSNCHIGASMWIDTGSKVMLNHCHIRSDLGVGAPTGAGTYKAVNCFDHTGAQWAYNN